MSSAPSPPFDLTLAFGPPPSAAETLRLLADACDRHGVDSPEVYGTTKSGGNPWLSDFELEVAAELGKEAAVFMPSGTMAQQIVICMAQKVKDGAVHTLPAVRRPVLLHPTSHMLLWEQESHARLLQVPALSCGDKAKPLGSLAVADALAGAAASGAASSAEVAKPCAVVLEMPHREIGGQSTPWAEVEAIKAHCAAEGMWLHADGARLWEALPFYAAPENGGLTTHQVCAPFDTIYVSFYKGLGGMCGAMLAGSKASIAEAKVWQRRFGGNLFTMMPYAVAAMDAFRSHKDGFGQRWAVMKAFAGAVTRAGAMAASTVVTGREGQREVRVGCQVAFIPDVPHCSLVHCHLKGSPAALEAARDRAAAVTGFKVFRVLRGESSQGPGWQYFEWNVGPVNGVVPAATVEAAWSAFFKELNAA